MSYIGECTKVFTQTGKVAHLLPPGDSPDRGRALSLCKRLPWLGDSWLGTGTHAEHERAALLPLCGTCGRLAREADEERQAAASVGEALS